MQDQRRFHRELFTQQRIAQFDVLDDAAVRSIAAGPAHRDSPAVLHLRQLFKLQARLFPGLALQRLRD
jgi:hypothetical protein